MAKMELLAPAGSFTALRAAVDYGADAVYFGLDGFNARAKAENCGADSLSDWLGLCHRFGVKAYLAANTLVKDSEMPSALAAVAQAYRVGADAFIVQDVGFANVLNRLYPEIPLHLSTQAGVGSPLGVRYLAQTLSFSRVILPRECGGEEISAMVATGKEIEVFVHGALCVAYSGNCYFSSMLTGNSGNRGKCQQFCRTEFSAAHPCVKTAGRYPLSPSDLCLVNRIGELAARGVTSVKIEGRLKRPEYVAETVRVYRRALDGEEVTEEDLQRLKAVYNRGNFTDGYFSGRPARGLMSPLVQGHTGLAVGRLQRVRNGTAEVASSRPLGSGDGFKLLDKAGRESGSASFSKALDVSKRRYLLKVSPAAGEGDTVCLTTDAARNAQLLSVHRRLPVSMRFTASPACCARLEASALGHTACVESEEPVQLAKSAPLSGERVRKQLEKCGDTVFTVERCEVLIEEGCFLDVASLNGLRRTVLEELARQIDASFLRKLPERGLQEPGSWRPKDKSGTLEPPLRERAGAAREIAAIIPDLSYLHSTMRDMIDYPVYAPEVLRTEDVAQYPDCAARSYLFLPHYLGLRDVELIRPLLPKFRGVYAGGAYALQLAAEAGVEAVGGELNVFNSYTAAFYEERGVKRVTLSKELNRGECQAIAEKLCAPPLLYAYGRAELMELHHCPVLTLTGKDCGHCGWTGQLTLTDRMGKVFPIRRRRYVGCVFTVENSLPQNLLSERTEGFGYILHPGEVSREKFWKIISSVREGNEAALPKETTRGHWNRGVK